MFPIIGNKHQNLPAKYEHLFHKVQQNELGLKHHLHFWSLESLHSTKKLYITLKNNILYKLTHEIEIYVWYFFFISHTSKEIEFVFGIYRRASMMTQNSRQEWSNSYFLHYTLFCYEWNEWKNPKVNISSQNLSSTCILYLYIYLENEMEN